MTNEGVKPDVVLPDGREIFIDMNKITIKEYRAVLRNQFEEQDDEDRVVCKAIGMDIEDYQSLGHTDWRTVIQGFFRKAREPLADPNSASASTSG